MEEDFKVGFKELDEEYTSTADAFVTSFFPPPIIEETSSTISGPAQHHPPGHFPYTLPHPSSSAFLPHHSVSSIPSFHAGSNHFRLPPPSNLSLHLSHHPHHSSGQQPPLPSVPSMSLFQFPLSTANPVYNSSSSSSSSSSTTTSSSAGPSSDALLYELNPPLDVGHGNKIQPSSVFSSVYQPPASPSSPEVDVEIEVQPPVEVRTRTPSEKRTFSCEIKVLGDFRSMGVRGVCAELIYATGNNSQPNQDILGGSKVAPIQEGGRVVFDNLSMSEASTKHKGAEFCLEFVLIGVDGQPLPLTKRRTRPFYAYSNQKVLSRRRNLQLRAISKTKGSSIGGDVMHVIGNLELYSESVLFFTLPPYPLPPNINLPDGTEIKCSVQISNDSRNFSNPMEFTYVIEGNLKRLRSRY